MERATIAYLAQPGAEFTLRVTPNASQADIRVKNGIICVSVTTQPEDGKANAAVQALLAKGLGVAKTRLTLLRGAKSRDKVFRLEP